MIKRNRIKMQIRSALMMLLGICLFISSCATVEPFAGDWVGSGVDSEGNEFAFAAKVIDLGGSQYRMLVLDALESQKEPMHVMDGVLTDGEFPYTADEGLYTGSGTLSGDVFEGWYKGPVDGSFVMYRVTDNDN